MRVRVVRVGARGVGLAALAAAQITPRDLVLEPSAGTGLLAILAEIAGGSLALVPTAGDGGLMEWQCRNRDVPEDHVPSECAQ